MSNVAVRIEGLGKRYFVAGKSTKKYRTFRDTLVDTVSAPMRRISDVVRGRSDSAAGLSETFWALKDISFDVQHGDVVGIVGRNGAGKSTLLKILSRITEPTEGVVKLNGRVGALLEVGTGFHPELTGRENIYLNAAILGMKRAEIDRKFDEIVAFAEIEQFIDTPVKHYSSGMGLRLGFSVAAHLEPEILIVDEVLAVGDISFQKKCLGKMGQVAGEGRTVLFVSHNMPAVIKLCSRAIRLNQGQIVKTGTVDEVIQDYEAESTEESQANKEINVVLDDYRLTISKVDTVVSLNGAGETSLNITIEGHCEGEPPRFGFGLKLTTPDGTLVSQMWPRVANAWIDELPSHWIGHFIFDGLSQNLMGGDYIFHLLVVRPQLGIVFTAENIAVVTLPASDPFGIGRELVWRKAGFVPLRPSFEVEKA